MSCMKRDIYITDLQNTKHHFNLLLYQNMYLGLPEATANYKLIFRSVLDFRNTWKTEMLTQQENTGSKNTALNSLALRLQS